MINNLSVLLIEDDDVAAESVTRSLKKIAPNVPVTIAENGLDAINVLRDKNSPLIYPFIVLLDLNMPVMSGLEFLDVVRNSKDLKDLVIFVLTTSNADSDKLKAYEHNVAGYMVKSAVGPQFSKLASLLKAYKETVEL